MAVLFESRNARLARLSTGPQPGVSSVRGGGQSVGFAMYELGSRKYCGPARKQLPSPTCQPHDGRLAQLSQAAPAAEDTSVQDASAMLADPSFLSDALGDLAGGMDVDKPDEKDEGEEKKE